MQRGEQLMPFKTKSGDALEILYVDKLSAEVGVDSISSLVVFFCFFLATQSLFIMMNKQDVLISISTFPSWFWS